MAPCFTNLWWFLTGCAEPATTLVSKLLLSMKKPPRRGYALLRIHFNFKAAVKVNPKGTSTSLAGTPCLQNPRGFATGCTLAFPKWQPLCRCSSHFGASAAIEGAVPFPRKIRFQPELLGQTAKLRRGKQNSREGTRSVLILGREHWLAKLFPGFCPRRAGSESRVVKQLRH